MWSRSFEPKIPFFAGDKQTEEHGVVEKLEGNPAEQQDFRSGSALEEQDISVRSSQ